jgi:ABC-type Mn2+/Zn2+ transport system permease subunit
MFWFERNKEPERYYLLPGMGGRALRQKQKMMLQWAIVTGLFVSVVYAIAMYYLNRPPWK